MRIAIHGWGSLIAKPGGLPLSGGWQTDGPMLKVEFSRISADGRLTLVIDPQGSKVRTYYAVSARNDLDDAVCDLRIREGTIAENIGTCSKDGSRNRSEKHPDVLPVVQAWLNSSEFDAAIWTDLESNYREKRRCSFEASDALAYLESLPPVCRENASSYIVQAPEQTRTSFKTYLQSKGWL